MAGQGWMGGSELRAGHPNPYWGLDGPCGQGVSGGYTKRMAR